MNEDTIANINSVKQNLKCIDDPYQIKGHFNSQTAANLMVVYEICDPVKQQGKCKEPEVIEDVLSGCTRPKLVFIKLKKQLRRQHPPT